MELLYLLIAAFLIVFEAKGWINNSRKGAIQHAIVLIEMSKMEYADIVNGYWYNKQ